MPYRDKINHAFFRIGATQGTSEGVLRAILDGLPPAPGPLNYLMWAAAAVLPHFRGDGELVSAAMDHHLDTLWFGGLARCIQRHPMLQREAEPPPLKPPPGGLDLAYYPEDAREAFDQGMLLKDLPASADLILLWKRSDRIAIMHAHPEGFWEVAPDPVAWITLLAEAMETGNSRGLIRFRTRRFCEASSAERFCLLTVDPELDALVAAGDLPHWLSQPGAVRDIDGVHLNGARIDILDELRPAQLREGAMLHTKQQGFSVWVDVSLKERARWETGEPPHPVHATASEDIRQQLEDILRDSAARTFSVTIGQETWTGLNPRRLLRKTAAIAAARKKGQGAAVAPELPRRTAPCPERLKL